MKMFLFYYLSLGVTPIHSVQIILSQMFPFCKFMNLVDGKMYYLYFKICTFLL